jgi:hypothetical protein
MGNEHSAGLPTSGTLEGLLAFVHEVCYPVSSVGLWIPRALTVAGETISTEQAMDKVCAEMRAKGFEVVDYHEQAGGWFYKFEL